MREWAVSQGINSSRLKVITDERAPVDAAMISNAVDQLTGMGTIEQLIVYFLNPC